MANLNAGVDDAMKQGGAAISYCPALEVFRCRLGNEERIFTPEEMVAMLVMLEKSGKIAERDAWTVVVAMAKKKPHEKIMVEGTGTPS